MNRRIDFTYNGGFPATQYMTDYMQKSYREALAAMAGLIGDKVILMGCEHVGSVITNGWISVAGELVPFVGGPWAADAMVAVVETSESRLFNDNNSHTVYFKREARLSTPGTFAFTELTRIGTLKTFIPPGLISMWSGAVSAIPAGWALCDGQNGTPDLKGRFVAGYDADDTDYDAIGQVGGEKEHKLSIQEMPAHTHTVNGDGEDEDRRSGSNSQKIHRQYGTKQSGSMGGGLPHENRPPYYVLAYIIKL